MCVFSTVGLKDKKEGVAQQKAMWHFKEKTLAAAEAHVIKTIKCNVIHVLQLILVYRSTPHHGKKRKEKKVRVVPS